ncbi:XRE family transcriptional regulator [Rhizorhapis sp. SPR117]|uniref:XRE family transcriptional regulator n=1 Tax=Rhizorhapis sp. SPR117 TaxID=2912611 RepID=UPI001F40945B|nr:XRE family transcriptional regulator [Rhizorhapis sp. SPR117]
MSSHAIVAAEEEAALEAIEEQRDYIPLILRAMADKDTAQRKLALKTGISKTRLALLLHSNPAKRIAMTLREFQTILRALDISIIQAIIQVEAFHGLELLQEERYATLIAMLCEVFRGLPMKLINALEELEGIDGSEVRKEWADPLQKAVVKRLIDEVLAVMDRRARFAQSDDFRI